MGQLIMTKEEFIAEAKRRGLPKEEVYAKFQSLSEHGAFDAPAPVVAAPVAAPAVEPVKAETVAKPKAPNPAIPAAPQGEIYGPEMDRGDSPKRDKASLAKIAELDHAPSRREWKAAGLPNSSQAERQKAWKMSKVPAADSVEIPGIGSVSSDVITERWKNDPVFKNKTNLSPEDLKTMMLTPSGDETAKQQEIAGRGKAAEAQDEIALMKDYANGNEEVLKDLMSGKRKLPYALWEAQERERRTPKGDSGIMRRVVADPAREARARACWDSRVGCGAG